MKGLLVVVSSPSGGGKTTIIKGLMNRGKLNYQYSISATTRPKRTNEIDGVDYFYVTREKFEQMKNGDELAEWAEVHGNSYGTPRQNLLSWLEQGKVVLLDIDIEGAQSIRNLFPDDSLLIFIKPPSIDNLMSRLTKRASESLELITKRLERVPVEMARSGFFDYVVINDDLPRTISEVEEIILKRVRDVKYSSQKCTEPVDGKTVFGTDTN